MAIFTKSVGRLRRRVESALRKEGPSPLFSFETVLLLLSVFYAAVVTLRARLYERGVLPSKTLPCRVVSIGNLVAGGTGKTPMTIFVAQMIQELGYRVVVISRGYGGQLEKRGGVVSDGVSIFKSSKEAGDEPYLMAKRLKGIPVVVGSRRYEAGLLAVKKFNPEVVVLDDAFQHLRLNRDLNLVLLDYSAPFGNGHTLPRGTLREPLSALRRAHAILFTRSHEGGAPFRPDCVPEEIPVFYTRHFLKICRVGRGDSPFLEDDEDISSLKGKRVVAFAGLADNHQFFTSLQHSGCDLLHTRSFADHHRYSGDDLNAIAELAVLPKAEALVTTLKDYVKIATDFPWPIELIAIDVQIQLKSGQHSFLSVMNGFEKQNSKKTN